MPSQKTLDLFEEEDAAFVKKIAAVVNEAAKVPFKFREDEICQEIFKYVGTTYGKHYVAKNNVQALDLIIASGHGKGFCLGNILKYASRWGKKAGNEADDLMKIIHYAMFLKFIYEEELKENNAQAKH